MQKTKLIEEVEFLGLKIGRWEPYGLWFVERPSGLLHVPVTLRIPYQTLREAQSAIKAHFQKQEEEKRLRLEAKRNY